MKVLGAELNLERHVKSRLAHIYYRSKIHRSVRNVAGHGGPSLGHAQMRDQARKISALEERHAGPKGGP